MLRYFLNLGRACLLVFNKTSYYFTNVKALFTTKVSKHFISRGPCYTFHVFTFSHLADAFIQSDLQLGVHKAINLEEANLQRKCQ